MKYFATRFIFILIVTVALVSCKSGKKDGSSELSDFPLEGLLNEMVSAMFMTVEVFEEEIESFLMIMIQENHQNVTLTINGNPVTLEGFMGFYFGDVNLTPGQNVSYNLTIDGTSRSGSLKVPNAIQGNFPAEFNLNADFPISWTSTSDPGGFLAYLDIEYEDDWIESFELLNGSRRNHTFNRNIYSGLNVEEIWWIDAGVSAMNFEMKSDMLIAATYDVYEEYFFNEEMFYKNAEKRGAVKERVRGLPAFFLK